VCLISRLVNNWLRLYLSSFTFVILLFTAVTKQERSGGLCLVGWKALISKQGVGCPDPLGTRIFRDNC
jgi:hypothetical protein